MRLKKRLISVFLALALCVTGVFCVPASALFQQRVKPGSQGVQIQTVEQYRDYLKNGYPTPTTAQFLKLTGRISKLIRAFTGRAILSDQYYNLTMDEQLSAFCAYICENCGLDIKALLTHMPESKQLAVLVVDTLQIDTVAFREYCFDLRDKFWDEGRSAESSIMFFLGVYFSIMESCDIHAIPTAEPNVVEVELTVTYRDGGCEYLHPGIFINTETGMAFGRDDGGMIGLGFDCSIPNLMVYATMHSWQRNFGFMVLYDVLADSCPLLFQYLTRRFHFDYQGKEWMVQIWKGKYLITNGGEVGLYNREPGSIGTFYHSITDEEMVDMSLQILHGDEIIVDEPVTHHWWLNAFRMDDVIYPPESLTLRFTITLYDQEMANALAAAVQKEYHHDVTCAVDGATVSCEWAGVAF